MNDEKAHHAERHLNHLVGVRVVHQRAALAERELVDVRFTRCDVRLRKTGDTVHAVR
jgi:hypothetical protein